MHGWTNTIVSSDDLNNDIIKNIKNFYVDANKNLIENTAIIFINSFYWVNNKEKIIDLLINNIEKNSIFIPRLLSTNYGYKFDTLHFVIKPCVFGNDIYMYKGELAYALIKLIDEYFKYTKNIVNLLKIS